jgi:hypothetical protein
VSLKEAGPPLKSRSNSIEPTRELPESQIFGILILRGSQMKNLCAFFALVMISGSVFAANIFECQFSATENAVTKDSTIKITSPDVGAKILYLANGELIFALPSVNENTAQLEFYIGGSCDGCTAVRFFQSDIYEKGSKTQFSSTGSFAGNDFAKSVFTYKIACAATP